MMARINNLINDLKSYIHANYSYYFMWMIIHAVASVSAIIFAFMIMFAAASSAIPNRLSVGIVMAWCVVGIIEMFQLLFLYQLSN